MEGELDVVGALDVFVCVSVFFLSILDIKFVGHTSRGRGRVNKSRISRGVL